MVDYPSVVRLLSPVNRDSIQSLESCFFVDYRVQRIQEPQITNYLGVEGADQSCTRPVNLYSKLCSQQERSPDFRADQGLALGFSTSPRLTNVPPCATASSAGRRSIPARALLT